MNRIVAGVLALFLSAAAPSLLAESYKDFGDYRIFYNAFSANLLAPQVAQQYNIPRSGYRAVLNITVRKQLPDGGDTAVPARVSGTATNLTGQLRQIRPREIEEQNAIYYIAVLPVADREVLDFDLQVSPEGTDASYPIAFRQQFFAR